MTERLADIDAHIAGMGQLGAVVNAMRGIAAARSRQAQGQLTAVDAYSAAIARAIGRIVALASATRAETPVKPGRLALVVFCAEEGFAGTFSERVLDTVAGDLAKSETFLVGTRGGTVLAQRGITATWAGAMPSRSPGVPKLANAIVEAIYVRMATGDIDRLDAVFSRRKAGQEAEVERRALFPIDPKAFPVPIGTSAPLLNLTPAALLVDLTADYLHAQLCEAALHAFAAENEARMEAMAAARSQIERKLSAMQATQRRVRQEQITAEIIELAAGESASQPI